MSLVTRISDLSARIASEIKTVRTEIGAGGGASTRVDDIESVLELTSTASSKGFVCDGDSITEGPTYIPVAPAYPTQLARMTGLSVVNLGVSSRTLATMDSTYASRNVGANYNAATRDTLVLLGGINDIMNTAGITLAALQASMTSYAGKAVASGFRLVLSTILPVQGLDAAKETLRTDFNTWIRANYVSLGAVGLADLAAIPDMQTPSSTVFYVDGLHPSVRGLSLIANTVAVAARASRVQLLANGNFDTDLNGWSFSSYNPGNFVIGPDTLSTTIVGGRMRMTAAADRQYTVGILPITGLTIGAVYSVAGQINASTQYGATVRINSTDSYTADVGKIYDSTEVLAPGVFTGTFTATQTTHFLKVFAGVETAGTYNEFDNFVIAPFVPEVYQTATSPKVLPKGGGSGQVLTKASAADYDLTWATPAAGGGIVSALDSRVLIATPTHTAQSADLGKVHIFTNAGGCVVTIPNTLEQGWNAVFVQSALTGKVTVVAGAGATVGSYGNPETPGQYAEIAVRVDTNVGGNTAAAFVAGGDGGPVGGGGTDLSGLAVFKGALTTPYVTNNNAFNTITLNSVVTDTHGGWNATNNTWVVPAGQGGMYDVQGKIRLNDGTEPGASTGIGINTANIDSPTFFWGVNNSNRNGLYNSDTMVLTAGQAVRLFGYFNTAGNVTVGAAALTIVRIR